MRVSSGVGTTVDGVEPVPPSGKQRERQWELFVALVGAGGVLSATPARPEAAVGSHYAWLLHDRERAALQSAWAQWFAAYDALLTPVLCAPAFPHQQEGDLLSRQLVVGGEPRPYLPVTWWRGRFGVLGLPVAVPPVGRTVGGPPGRHPSRHPIPARP